jgi:hypothetical protein
MEEINRSVKERRRGRCRVKHCLRKRMKNERS